VQNFAPGPVWLKVTELKSDLTWAKVGDVDANEKIDW
jgi:hypothetical protein